MLAFLVVCVSLTAGTEPGRLAVIRPAPSFELIDANDNKASLKSFEGRVLLVGFLFTTCNGTCPATTHRLAKIQDAWNRSGADRQRVQFATITLDPVRDTPEALRSYARLFELDTSNWSLLTGSRDQVEKTLAQWGMWARPTTNGQIDHPSRIYLVDKRGRIREIYSLEFLRTEWVLEDLRLLVDEP